MTSQKGFTLIEFIIYITIVSSVITAVTLFSLNLIEANNKTTLIQKVSSEMRFINKRIALEIRNASAINAISTTNICLSNSNANRNPTSIYLNNGQLFIAWGGGSVNCSSMTNTFALSDPKIIVSAFSFSQNSNNNNQTINLYYTIGSSGMRSEWQFSLTSNSTIQNRIW